MYLKTERRFGVNDKRTVYLWHRLSPQEQGWLIASKHKLARKEGTRRRLKRVIDARERSQDFAEAEAVDGFGEASGGTE